MPYGCAFSLYRNIAIHKVYWYEPQSLKDHLNSNWLLPPAAVVHPTRAPNNETPPGLLLSELAVGKLIATTITNGVFVLCRFSPRIGVFLPLKIGSFYTQFRNCVMELLLERSLAHARFLDEYFVMVIMVVLGAVFPVIKVDPEVDVVDMDYSPMTDVDGENWELSVSMLPRMLMCP